MSDEDMTIHSFFDCFTEQIPISLIHIERIFFYECCMFKRMSISTKLKKRRNRRISYMKVIDSFSLSIIFIYCSSTGYYINMHSFMD